MAFIIVGSAVNSLVLWNFFPMHMRDAEKTFTDTMHLILAINPFVLLYIGLGTAAFRNWFRFYSIGTILILFVPAIFAFSYFSQVGANQPTPWLGLTERISQYSFMLWQAVLAIVLVRVQGSTTPDNFTEKK
jgi:predicted SAM-dependent methyltransferase